MFGFGKKKENSILPPLPSGKAPAPVRDEIELIPEDLPEFPSELPALEIKTTASVSMPEKKEQAMKVIPASEVVAMRVAKELLPNSNKYIKTEVHHSILSGINEINSDFDSMNEEIERVIELKDARNQKIDGMQSTLEDVGKKLMEIDQTMFGG